MCPHQVSFVVLHPRRADEVVLLAPPVPEAAEEVVGEESIDGVPDDVDVNRLFYPEPGGDIVDMRRWRKHHLPSAAADGQRGSPGEVEEVHVPRVEEGLRNVADVFHEIHLKRKKTPRRFFYCF